MKNLSAQLGIQSYCFRGTKALGDALTRLKACGVATVELSGVHGDFTRDADAIIAQCRAAGVRIASIGVERFTGNIARERLLAEFMRKAGASVIAVGDESLPFRDQSFDLVISRHPVTTPWHEIARVLERGGTVLS